MSPPRLMICPFCGHTQRPAERCQDCGTAFESMARKATLAQMGPWFVRDAERPFQPGCSYETLRTFVTQGRVGRYTIVRGPTTRQLWTVARHVPGLAHLLGYCHACDAPVRPDDEGCSHCGALFTARYDRDSLGLLDDEGESHPSIPGRSVGFVPAPAQRLSAFASDEELLDAGTSTHPQFRAAGREAALPARSSTDGRGDTAVRPVPEAGAEHSVHASIERSLRGALRRQRLTSAFLLGLVISLVVASAWLFMRGSGWGRTDHGVPAPATEANGPGRIPASAHDHDETAPGGSRRDVGSESVPSGPVEGGAAAVDSLDAIAGELQALAGNRAVEPDARRSTLAALEQRLAGIVDTDPPRAAELQRQIEALRAQIELDAVLPADR